MISTRIGSGLMFRDRWRDLGLLMNGQDTLGMYIGLYEGNGIWTGRVRGLDGMGIHGYCRKRGKVGVFLFFLCVCVCVDWSSHDHNSSRRHMEK